MIQVENSGAIRCVRPQFRAGWLQTAIEAAQAAIDVCETPRHEPSAWLQCVIPSMLRLLDPPETRHEELLLRGLICELAARAGVSAVKSIEEYGEWLSRRRPFATDDRPTKGARALPHSPHVRSIRSNVAMAERAKELIEARYMDLITIKKIAGELRCHPVHLERVFRQAHGIPVHRYLRLVRVRASLQLLKETNLKTFAISLTVGFKSKATLYRAVREFTGRTPGAWRGHANVQGDLLAIDVTANRPRLQERQSRKGGAQ